MPPGRVLRSLADGWSRYEGAVPRHTAEVVHAFERAGLWGNRSVFEVFASAVEEFPLRRALAADGRVWTFTDLHDNCLALARGLVARGVGAGDVVVVQLPNGDEFVRLALACARIGAIFCPVNVRLRTELEHILALTDAPLVVVPGVHRGFDHTEHAESLSAGSGRAVLTVGGDGPARGGLAGIRATNGRLPEFPDPNGPWLLEFTSGTTADPKGVVRTHNTTLATLRAMTEFFGLSSYGAGDVVLAAPPITFIYSFYLAVLMPLLHGSTSVVLDSTEPDRVLDAIDEHCVTLFPLVPSMMEPLLEAHERREGGAASLQIVQVGGAVTPAERKLRMMEQLDCDVLDVYGLTECCWPVGHRPTSPLERKLTTAGTVCDTTDLRLEAPPGRAPAAGEPGEVLLRGPTLTPGYFGAEAATAAAIDAQGWFRTGDLGVVDDSGYVRIVGRRKEMIVTGGVNVAPSEVEACLETHPRVRAAAVVGVEDVERGEAVWAAVALSDGPDAAPTGSDLQVFLRERIATYKVPRRIVVVKEIPTSSVGKVQRRRVREMLSAASPDVP